MAASITAGPGIELSALSKSYGDVRAVRSVDLTIAPGETVALLGPNGAGKSTTVDLLLGLTQPDAGRVSLFGMAPARAVATGAVGGMLQTGSLVEYLSVRELVTMVASLYPRPLAVDEALEATGAAAFADRPTNRLSGGQTQRVRFAMALVANPQLLVLDEPTAAIDVEGRREFWATMRAVAAGGKTVLFATHYLEEADAYADRIVVMARGRVVADGPGNEIKAMVRGRTIRATVPCADGADGVGADGVGADGVGVDGAGVDAGRLAALAGVTAVDRRGDTVVLTCTDSDAALRALLAAYPTAHGIEVHGAGLEEAFMALTAGDHDDAGHHDESHELEEVR